MKTLVDSMMESCTMLDAATVADGQGGFSKTWVEGAKFQAAFTKASSIEAKIAEKQGVTELYTITVRKGTALEYHDIIRRDSDGTTYRVTSNIKDSESPKVSTLNMGTVSAERWELR